MDSQYKDRSHCLKDGFSVPVGNKDGGTAYTEWGVAGEHAAIIANVQIRADVLVVHNQAQRVGQ